MTNLQPTTNRSAFPIFRSSAASPGPVWPEKVTLHMLRLLKHPYPAICAMCKTYGGMAALLFQEPFAAVWISEYTLIPIRIHLLKSASKGLSCRNMEVMEVLLSLYDNRDVSQIL